jgi:hypothetical protein
MNGNAIRNISSLIPVSGPSWTVRNLSAGAGINIPNDGAGTYTIENTLFTRYGARYSGGNVGRVTFDNINVNLATHRVTGVIQVGADGSFDYPLIIFNNKYLTAGINTSSNANLTDEWAQTANTFHGGQYQTGYPGVTYYHQDFSQSFCDRPIPDGNGHWILKFTIDLLRRHDSGEYGNAICTGEYNYYRNVSGNDVRPYYSYYGVFNRGSNIITITNIGIQGFFTNNTIRYATCNLIIEPLPTYLNTGVTTL